MISAGYLTDKVYILYPVMQGKDEFGSQLVKWTKSQYRWARVNYLRGSRVIVSGDVFASNQISVTLRYSAALTEKCKLMWDGKVYQIESLNRSISEGTMTVGCSRIADEITIVS